jgi:hypothetical protein
MSACIQLPRQFEAGARPRPVVILCPYPGCDGRVTATIHGDVIDVWIGHGLSRIPECP